MTRTVQIKWRDENYGAFSGCTAACRTDMALQPERTQSKVRKALKGAGFEMNPNRQAWISYRADAKEALLSALAAAEITVS